MNQSAGTIKVNYADEERLESLMTRLRPLLLNNETAYWAVVLSAVKTLLHKGLDDDIRAADATLRAEWKAAGLAKRTKADGGFFMQVAKEGGGFGEVLDDRTLWDAWLYGDLVHGFDDRLNKTREHGLRARLQAAQHVVPQLVGVVQRTLIYLETLDDEGLLTLGSWCLTDDVEVEAGEMQLTRVTTWEAGAEPPLDVGSWDQLLRGTGAAMQAFDADESSQRLLWRLPTQERQ